MSTFPLWLAHRRLQVALAQQVARIAREAGEPLPAGTAGATPVGDPSRLRGLPAIGRGVGGAMAGSRPEDMNGKWARAGATRVL